MLLSKYYKPEFDVRLAYGKPTKSEIWSKKHEGIAGYFKGFFLQRLHFVGFSIYGL